MHDSGIAIKRTTARKYYLALPKASKEEEWQFGSVVFFNDLRHVGIVDDYEWFYHAQVMPPGYQSSHQNIHTGNET
jgi:hypothetical protein